MTAGDVVQRVRIYLNERDAHAGQPLYLAVMELLRREGATGATALRGIAGFGAGHLVRPGGPVDLTQAQPVVIEWVDRVERVARVLPALDELLQEALITIEDLRAYRAALRSAGPFGGRSVGEVLAADVVTGELEMPLRDAVLRMVERDQPLLPVLDAQQRVAGVLDGGVLLRAGLALPLRLLRALTPDEQGAVLAMLPPVSLSDLLAPEPRTIYVQAPIAQLVSTLVDWDLEALPVVGRDGVFAGLVGVEQALAAALAAQPAADSGVRDAEPPPPIRLLMQTAVASVAVDAPIGVALGRLLATAERFLVVTDGGRPVGGLTDAQLIGALPEPLRGEWLAALRAAAAQPQDRAAPMFAPDDLTAGDVAQEALVTGELTTQAEAIRLLLDRGHERLIVTDEEGQLVGMLGRRGLLRALSQA